jgi:asparagine synthase (glutamine-hydrolysing)
MSQLVKEPIHTFSVGFAEADFNELHYSRAVADLFKTIHHEYLISPASALQVIEGLLINFGEPYAFPSCIATYFMNRIARPFVTVVLTGDGSDEIFCGYNRYKLFNNLPDLPQSPNLLAKIDVELLRSGPRDIAVEYQSVLTDGLRDSLKRRLYSKQFINGIPGAVPVNYLAEMFARNTHLGSRLDRAMDVDCNFWLRDAQLVKMDITAMANSVEARSPLLDEKVVEFATGVGVNHKLVDGGEKHILKTLAKSYLPDAITSRPKQELAVPLESWLSTCLRKPITETLLSEAALSRGYFIPDRLIEFVENYDERDSYSIWTLYILEKWQQIAETGSPQLSDADHLAQALC